MSPSRVNEDESFSNIWLTRKFKVGEVKFFIIQIIWIWNAHFKDTNTVDRL